ncbi:Intracellular distribution of mitochondria [Batrachochytrium dendrobatidis]
MTPASTSTVEGKPATPICPTKSKNVSTTKKNHSKDICEPSVAASSAVDRSSEATSLNPDSNSTAEDATALTADDVESTEAQQATTIELVFPNDLGIIQIMALPTSTIQDIRQVVYESPKSQFYTCFYIAHEGNRQNELSQLQSIQGFPEKNQFFVVQDVYNESEVRVHINRLREILTAYQPSLNLYGIDQSASFLSSIDRDSIIARETFAPIGKAKKENEATTDNEEKTITDGENKIAASGEMAEPVEPEGEAATESTQRTRTQDPMELKDVTAILDGILSSESLITNISEFVPPRFHSSPEPCLKSINLSCWNPPPLYRRMAGDLLYLSIVTLEGTVLEITSSVSGFYINGCTDTTFDPTLNKKSTKVMHMLPDLLSKASAQFEQQFGKLQEQITGHHPFEYVLTSLPSYPWIVQPRVHKNDPGRSMDMAFVASDVIDAISTHDWNEELQSARDLSKETPQERITRDQAVFKAHSDFVDAAVRGAVSIVNKTLSSINPLEADASQMYIHNNIFFSEGYDNRDQFDPYGGEEAAHVAASKDIDGIRLISNIDAEGVYTIGTAVVDYMGRRIVCQSIVPGLLHRAANQEPTVQYGSIDSGKEIASNSKFDELIATKLAKSLHLKKHKVLDEKKTSHDLYTSVETKGVFGTDSRSYMLDLFRLTPVDIQFLETVDAESETNPYPHRMTLLRPELIESFYEHKVRFAIQEHQQAVEEAKKSTTSTKKAAHGKKTKTSKESPKEDPQIPFEFDLSFNMDAFTCVKTGDANDVTDSSEMSVREVSLYVTRQISQLVLDVVNHPSSIPADSDGLTKMLHRRGINMRYLGKLIDSLLQVTEPSIKFILDLSTQETILRASKRILRNYLKDLPQFLAGSCISHFLNCYYADDDATVVPEKLALHHTTEELAFMNLTPAGLHAEIRKQVSQRFRHQLSANDTFWKTRPTAFVRALALVVGFQLQSTSAPFSTTTAALYKPSDIANVYPLVKHAQPRSSYAEDAFEHGRYMLLQNRKELGIELLRESLSMSEQIYGPIHPNVCRIFGSLAMIHFNDDDLERALYFQQRAIVVSERINGIDSAETIQQYMNLAYFEFVAGHSKLGLEYMKHAARYWSILCDGSKHPDTTSIYSNLGSMLQRLDHRELAVTYFELAAMSCVETHGAQHLNTALTYEALAKGQCMIDEYRKAIQSERIALEFFESKLGKEDERTIEASKFLNLLMTRAVSIARLEKEVSEAMSKGTFISNESELVDTTVSQPSDIAPVLPESEPVDTTVPQPSSIAPALPESPATPPSSTTAGKKGKGKGKGKKGGK